MRPRLIVSSAAGGGYGALRALDEHGHWASFGPPEIRDPRGVRRLSTDAYVVVNEPFGGVWLLGFDGTAIARIDLPPGLDPGGGAFGADGAYYVGSRARRSIECVDLAARRYRGRAVSLDGIAFPRGFAMLGDGSFVVASGTHPVLGGGRRALLCYSSSGKPATDPLVDDPALDPLDLVLRDEYLYVTSEFPFGSDGAIVSLRRYDARTGAPAGVWSAENTPALAGVRGPRGIAFFEDGTLVLCAQNCVAAIDVCGSGTTQIVAWDDRLAGQSLAALPTHRT